MFAYPHQKLLTEDFLKQTMKGAGGDEGSASCGRSKQGLVMRSETRRRFFLRVEGIRIPLHRGGRSIPRGMDRTHEVGIERGSADGAAASEAGVTELFFCAQRDTTQQNRRWEATTLPPAPDVAGFVRVKVEEANGATPGQQHIASTILQGRTFV